MAKRTCSVCGSRIYKAGLCSVHFTRPVSERFWSKVDKSGDCWLWTGPPSSDGYGHLQVKGRNTKAHRIAYELMKGPIPQGLQIDHICHNRMCVNPEHLRPVTNKQNRENLKGPQSNCKSGVLGVTAAVRPRGHWRATVKHDGQMYHVGCFKTIGEAEAAVVAKRLELFTHNEVDKESA